MFYVLVVCMLFLCVCVDAFAFVLLRRCVRDFVCVVVLRSPVCVCCVVLFLCVV